MLQASTVSRFSAYHKGSAVSGRFTPSGIPSAFLHLVLLGVMPLVGRNARGPLREMMPGKRCSRLGSARLGSNRKTRHFDSYYDRSPLPGGTKEQSDWFNELATDINFFRLIAARCAQSVRQTAKQIVSSPAIAGMERCQHTCVMHAFPT